VNLGNFSREARGWLALAPGAGGVGDFTAGPAPIAILNITQVE